MIRTFSARAILVTCLTAVVSVMVTTAVALPVAVASANRQARQGLDEKATLVGDVLVSARPAERENLVRGLRQQRIQVYLVRRGVVDRPGLPPRVVKAVAAGLPVDQRATIDGQQMLVAGRPLAAKGNSTADGNGVVLTRQAVTGTAGLVLGNLWLALVAGLVAGLAAGVLLARLVTTPIREAAAAAGRLRSGDHTVRLAVRSPAEVADLAESFNQLAAALATSEGRQRDFLLSVSHELRTPLTTIRGYAEALADGVVGPDGAPKAGHTMLDEADRLDRLISDLLVLARLEAADLPVEPIPVDLVELIGAAAEAWGGRCAPVGVVLGTELPDAPVVVRTDPGRIRQVVDGLCENALRVVPAGAPLVLAVRPGPDSGVVEVRDGGPGFTDDDLAVAFERGALYQRYRGVRKVGSGLGLALAARLVRRLGGAIEAGHAPEGGARFTVTLPYAR
ncbi:sensor histidine kinase [Planosporangium mesophilum]|uniref:histidine kinase n=1 Tax=Planosporangium mesophilum TaxID=689768 RepID=A0A8J3TC15_9ACTN|nr:HAMP domain-containing sensor histidine kinase [Planosporangium mesophilum]NJC84623.1 HAMP domain-containing histidine kinase [Planosporangium mesophilum]GII23933.1 two-component sensor histidine kinase [Planosporangium mesophilum]